MLSPLFCPDLPEKLCLLTLLTCILEVECPSLVLILDTLSRFSWCIGLTNLLRLLSFSQLLGSIFQFLSIFISQPNRLCLFLQLLCSLNPKYQEPCFLLEVSLDCCRVEVVSQFIPSHCCKDLEQISISQPLRYSAHLLWLLDYQLQVSAAFCILVIQQSNLK